MDKSERKKILNKIDIGEILNQLHSGLSICNENGEMLYITENYEEIYGIKIEDVMGRCNREFTATKNPISDNVLESGKKIITKQETPFGDTMFVTGVPIFDKNKKVKYAVVYNSWEISNENELIDKYEFLKNENNRLQMEIDFMNNKKRHSYNHLVALSEKMKEVIQKIEQANSYNVPVFISGEKGCGKRYMAGYLHHLSERGENTLHYINLNEVGDLSIEEVLFGAGEKQGMLQICENGTLVVESVEKMSFSMQNMLAQFIKSHEYIDVLGERKVSDVKVIFISNASANSLHERKMLSNKLYYQIGKIEIVVPPLRQRLEDLDYFIDYYLKFYNEKYKKILKLSSKAKGALLAYPWPENVREVRLVMEQTVLGALNSEISVYDLPENITKYYYGNAEAAADLKTMLEYYERKIVIETYKRCKTSVALAKELNISQASASRKITKYIGKEIIQK